MFMAAGLFAYFARPGARLSAVVPRPGTGEPMTVLDRYVSASSHDLQVRLLASLCLYMLVDFFERSDVPQQRRNIRTDQPITPTRSLPSSP